MISYYNYAGKPLTNCKPMKGHSNSEPSKVFTLATGSWGSPNRKGQMTSHKIVDRSGACSRKYHGCDMLSCMSCIIHLSLILFGMKSF